MSNLARVVVTFGLALAVMNAACLCAPGRWRGFLAGFPRSRPAAWILSAVALVWAGRLLFDAPLGRFDTYKPLLYVLVPVAVVLVCVFVDELLAARSLGGMLLLLAAPMLDNARWHDSPLRLVPVTLAYLLVVAGVVLVVCPYRFRRTVETCLHSDRLCRIWGAVGCLLGIGISALGLAVF
jgi:hypothetical protein